MTQKRDPYGHLMAVWDEHQYCGGCRNKGIGSDPCVLKLACSHCTAMEDGKKKAQLIRPSRPYKDRPYVQKRRQEKAAKRCPGPSPGTRKDPGPSPGTIKDPGPSPGTRNDPDQIQTGSGPARDMPSPDLSIQGTQKSTQCPGTTVPQGTTVPGTGHHSARDRAQQDNRAGQDQELRLDSRSHRGHSRDRYSPQYRYRAFRDRSPRDRSPRRRSPVRRPRSPYRYYRGRSPSVNRSYRRSRSRSRRRSRSPIRRSPRRSRSRGRRQERSPLPARRYRDRSRTRSPDRRSSSPRRQDTRTKNIPATVGSPTIVQSTQTTDTVVRVQSGNVTQAGNVSYFVSHPLAPPTCLPTFTTVMS